MKKNYIFWGMALVLLTFACRTREKIVEVEKIIKDTVKINVLVDGNFDPNKGVLKMSFEHFVGNQPFQRDVNFQDANGNTFRFKEIRYWVSNIELIKDNNDVVKIEDGYFLIENRDTIIFHGTTNNVTSNNMKSPPRVRESFTVGNIPVGNYKKIRFAIGVDPKYNDNFALKAGELDINQMAMLASWAWKTSYIFLRTRGIWQNANDPLDVHRFVVETGGNDMYRTIEFDLTNNPIISAPSKISEVKIRANVLELFGGGLPAVPSFAGTKPSGWARDPNMEPYNKFVNAGAPTQMEIVANNTKNSFFTLNQIVQ